jgi:hypothetical protein
MKELIKPNQINENYDNVNTHCNEWGTTQCPHFWDTCGCQKTTLTSTENEDGILF